MSFSLSDLLLPLRQKEVLIGKEGFRIVQFSDLHFSPHTSSGFLNKLHKKIQALRPDLIAFTGDFLCYSKLWNPEGLSEFLNRFEAPLGCYAVLGNHDYAKPIGVDPLTGDYALLSRKRGNIVAGLQLLFHRVHLTGKVTAEAKNTPPHQELIALLKSTPFRLLHNETVLIDGRLNLTGVGEHSAGDDLIDLAYANYRTNLPGIALAHNPDSYPALASRPSSLVLSGHTHGAQINLPFVRDRLTLLENPNYKRGLHGKLYVNRGVGSAFPLRLFSSPEITLFLV